MQLIVQILPLLLILLLVGVGFAYMNRQVSVGRGGVIIVRCDQEHLFTTIWIPFVSFKAIRLGPLRFQHCPVGRHWAFVKWVDETKLTSAEREFAFNHPDSLVP